MTRYLAITTANEKIWAAHGQEMAATFVEHWPQNIPLVVYAEDFDIQSDDRICALDLYGDAPWLRLFKIMYRDQRYNGGPDSRDYRHDAVRFSHKIAAIGAAAEDADCDVLIWMDADIVTHAPVTRDWLGGLFPQPAAVGWLDRDGAYPECGFVMFRLPEAGSVIRAIVKAYRNGDIFKLQEWHDSFVIQHYVQRSGVKVHSLSGPEGRKCVGHPLVNSPVGACLDHLKGEIRKRNGRSLPQDIKVPRPEAYWR